MRAHFNCSLSGHKVQSLPGYGIRINGLTSHISRQSYLALLEEARCLNLICDRNQAGAAEIITIVGSEPSVDFYVYLHGLRDFSGWRENIDKIINNSDGENLPNHQTPPTEIHSVPVPQLELALD
jgi:hypothetical protein